MPELPEVETIRRELAPLVRGRRLERMEILDARWSRPLAPTELAAALEGRRIESLDRRGKYLLWRFEDDVFLAQHLRMTGGLLWEPESEPAHVGVRLLLAKGGRGVPRARLLITDTRRFGTGELLVGAAALEAFFGDRLGLEPLDDRFTEDHLRKVLRGRRAPIKAALLDQRLIAGVGNIYADEALFRARIHPLRPAGRLTRQQLTSLRRGLVDALCAGIVAKGASVDDYRHIDGGLGRFQDQFLVHRRAGEPCPDCGGEITKIVAAGRGTYVCESCQPPPRRASTRSRRRRARRGRVVVA
jgi:formamidopyrimidine-DNA glycosylase